MANKYYLKEKIYTLLNQKIALQASYPGTKAYIVKDTLLWSGQIRPTPLSKEYTVLLKYKLWESPDVWVIGDELENLDAKDFPHHFHIDSEKKEVRICLYRYHEFSVTKLLSNTVVPWTVEWLYFYEVWLTTGEWLGGGEHPSIGDSKVLTGSKVKRSENQKSS